MTLLNNSTYRTMIIQDEQMIGCPAWLAMLCTRASAFVGGEKFLANLPWLFLSCSLTLSFEHRHATNPFRFSWSCMSIVSSMNPVRLGTQIPMYRSHAIRVRVSVASSSLFHEPIRDPLCKNFQSWICHDSLSPFLFFSVASLFIIITHHFADRNQVLGYLHRVASSHVSRLT